MERNDSYHILIYGTEYHNDIKIIPPFKEYLIVVIQQQFLWYYLFIKKIIILN